MRIQASNVSISSSQRADRALEPGKEADAIEQRIQPAGGHAIALAETASVMPGVAFRRQDEPVALEPANAARTRLGMRPLVELVRSDGGQQEEEEPGREEGCLAYGPGYRVRERERRDDRDAAVGVF